MNKGWWSNRGYTRMFKKLSVQKIDYQKHLIDKELQENNVVNHKKHIK
ncbi:MULTISPECIES: hypothetical protein [unclassified Spiroplasma]|nr:MULTISPECIES: hypothetical protein [unclassified Spiroplasma]